MSARPARLSVSLLIAILSLIALLIGLVPNPRPPISAGPVPLDQFSSARARRCIRHLAQSPRLIGTPEHDRARDYIVSELTRIGLAPHVQQTAVVNMAPYGWAVGGNVSNVIARIPGARPTGTVLLSAHYDTVVGSPGAADDGTGVAVLLETARALRRAPALANDIVFLFTDGEEYGLLGARAFLSQYKLPLPIAVTLNFEARGSTGPVYLFETSPSNSALIQAFARSVHYPDASSLFYEIYRKLPNDTDLTVFKEAGFPGMNFAFVDRFVDYHTPEDTDQNLDEHSLQQAGLYAVSLARAFGNSTRAYNAGGNLVYFTIARSALWMYPAAWALPLSIIASALVLAALALALWRRRVALSAVAAGFAAVLAAALVAVLCAFCLSRAISALRPNYASFITGDVYHHWAFLAAELVAAAAAIFLVLAPFLRRWPPLDLWFGALLSLSAADLLLASAAPGASYLLTWPHFAAALCVLLASTNSAWFWQPAENSRQRLSPRAMVALAAASLVSTVFLAGLFPLLAQALALGADIPFALLLALLLSWQIPVVWHWSRVRLAWMLLAALLATVALVALGILQNRFNARQPLQAALFYGLHPADGHAVWAARGRPADDPWIRAHFRPRPLFGPLPDFAVFGGAFTSAPAPPLPLPPPQADLQAVTPSAPARVRWAIHVYSPRGASNIILANAANQNDSLALVSLNGHAALGSANARFRGIILRAVPPQGDTILFDAPANTSPAWQIVDWTPGLPSALSPDLTRPPADLTSGAQFDLYNWSTVVSSRAPSTSPP